ncbi:MAG: hypothetical protein Q9207_002862 [Kuettlingeria erythrocarpa]
MDAITRTVLRLPAPVARPVPPFLESVAKQQFPRTKFVPATEAGYRTEGCKATGVEEDKKIRRLTAKLYMFRHTGLEEDARLAASNVLPSNTSDKIALHWKQYDDWKDAWQNQMMSTTAGRWFPEFVAFHVTTFNYKAYLANINRQARRWYHYMVDETALARQTRIDEQEELLTTLSERAAMWKRSVEKQIAETGATLQAMGPGSIPIEENLYADTMDVIMAQTFVVAAYNAWDMLLRPRAENAALQERHSEKDLRTVHSQCSGRPFREQPLVVYAKVKAMQLAMFDDMPGIECIMVPAKGPNCIREGKRAKRGLEEEEMVPMKAKKRNTGKK